MKTYTISVTETDIRTGKRCGGETCPLALALTRRLGFKVVVGISAFWKPGFCVRELPDKAFRFRKAFDHQGRKAVKPIRFQVKL